MRTIGISIICKTPAPGKSKTRLSPPLRPEQCAEASECFIRDLTANIQAYCKRRRFSGYAIYTPAGSEPALRRMLPAPFGLILQGEGDLGARLLQGIQDLLAEGHHGAIIINADSPTLPTELLDEAVERLLAKDCVVFGPAIDGGYTFVGLNHPHRRLFEEIPWSTEAVHRLTMERAAEIGLPVFNTQPWYDVDDPDDWTMLCGHLAALRRAGADPGAPHTESLIREAAS